MPITPFLPTHHAFDPDQINIMGQALTYVCKALGLASRDDPARRRIIEHAQRGVRSRKGLGLIVLEEYQQRPR